MKITDNGGATAGFGASCGFTIDNSGPANPPGVSSTVFQDCVANPACNAAGAVGVSTPVTFTGNGDPDVKSYEYWWDRTPTVKTSVTTTSGAPVTVDVTPAGLPNGSPMT